jgi:hypothetical protein
MDRSRETAGATSEAAVAEAWQEVAASFERFYLMAGVSALSRWKWTPSRCAARTTATRTAKRATVGAARSAGSVVTACPGEGQDQDRGAQRSSTTTGT